MVSQATISRAKTTISRAKTWAGDRLTPAEVKPSAPPAPRVLVVDRDNLHRMIICRAADKAGCVPAGAANLAEAGRLAQSAAFDGITLDLSFGREAVLDFFNRLDALHGKAKIIVTGHRDTARWQDEAVRHAALLGLDVEDDVAAKPLDIEMLRRVFEQLRIQSALAHETEAVPPGADPAWSVGQL
jgi:two-component system, chemotaxis family, chemotaxis protein CheY